MIMKTKKFVIAGAAAATAALIGGGVAFAMWTAGGSGSGQALAVVAQPVTMNAVSLSNSAASLFPGGPAGNVYIQIVNPNPYPVEINTLQWGTPTSNIPTACPSSVISVDANAPSTGFHIDVPANGQTNVLQINAVLDLSAQATNGCQGVGFSAPVTLIGQQLP
jgi:hypothetical protein